MGHSVHYLTFLPLISLTCKMETKVPYNYQGGLDTFLCIWNTCVHRHPSPTLQKECLFANPQSPGSETMYVETMNNWEEKSERQRGKLGPFRPER